MNQRICELGIQAMAIVLNGNDPDNDIDKMYIPSEFTKKFAKLIAQECIDTLLKESKWYWDKDEFESSNAIQNAARRLKEHFGV